MKASRSAGKVRQNFRSVRSKNSHSCATDSCYFLNHLTCARRVFTEVAFLRRPNVYLHPSGRCYCALNSKEWLLSRLNFCFGVDLGLAKTKVVVEVAVQCTVSNLRRWLLSRSDSLDVYAWMSWYYWHRVCCNYRQRLRRLSCFLIWSAEVAFELVSLPNLVASFLLVHTFVSHGQRRQLTWCSKLIQ